MRAEHCVRRVKSVQPPPFSANVPFLPAFPDGNGDNCGSFLQARGNPSFVYERDGNDGDIIDGTVAFAGLHRGNLVNDVESFNGFSEDGIFTVKVFAALLTLYYVKLRSARFFAGIDGITASCCCQCSLLWLLPALTHWDISLGMVYPGPPIPILSNFVESLVFGSPT